MTHEYVIVNEDGEFYAGGGKFALEYPDAKTYDDEGDALKAAYNLSWGRDSRRGMNVIANYGMDNEVQVGAYA